MSNITFVAVGMSSPLASSTASMSRSTAASTSIPLASSVSSTSSSLATSAASAIMHSTSFTTTLAVALPVAVVTTTNDINMDIQASSTMSPTDSTQSLFATAFRVPDILIPPTSPLASMLGTPDNASQHSYLVDAILGVVVATVLVSAATLFAVKMLRRRRRKQKQVLDKDMCLTPRQQNRMSGSVFMETYGLEI
ncbi:hypothetical protein BC830DRAFT_1174658 [Chytriomyces sp. MP71]|nr:hypothetical protein BC830DRAFT_1174658 [Chytriomyces sp. MP71]